MRTVLVLMALVFLIIMLVLLITPFKQSNQLIQPAVTVEAKEITVPELVSRINNFTLNLYGELLKEHWNRNIVVSPFNVYIALTLLYEGTNGSTRTEMGNVMGLTNVDVCKAYQQLLDSLPIGISNETALMIANAIWLKQGFPFKTKYIETISKCYRAEAKYFSTIDQLVKEVNSWVSNRTRGLIRKLLDKDTVGDVVAVIVSAIYFKAEWVEKFKPSAPIRFWTGESYVEAQAMEVISDIINVVHDVNYTAVEIPYRNTSISMIILIPENYTEIRTRYKELIMDALSKLNETHSKKTVWLIMPKFNITLKTNLVSYLQNMGIREVFIPGKADLTKMANVEKGSIWVDKAIHQAVIKVNEKGTKAAAATAIVVVTSLPLADEKIIVNKPFIYMLWDRKSNAILFIGHVVNPAEAK